MAKEVSENGRETLFVFFKGNLSEALILQKQKCALNDEWYI